MLRKQSAEPRLPVVASEYKQCCWNAGGDSCRYPGTMCKSTLADKDTQWFCWIHFDCSDPVKGAQGVIASRDYVHPKRAELDAQFLAWIRRDLERQGLTRTAPESADEYRNRLREMVRRSLKHLTTAAHDGTHWAREIVRREAAGEAVGMYASMLARQALPQREPGDDESEDGERAA